MRDSNGRIVTQFIDKTFITTLTNDYRTPAEIAKIVKCSQSSAQKTLKRLYQSQMIDGLKIANRWLYRRAQSDSKSLNTCR